MLKAGKSRKGHLTGMIYNLALSCEKELDFLSIIHELQWGRLAGTTIFRAADEVSGITLAAQPGDEIVVWKGMDCPMVVRKMVDDETGEEYFKMISTAYVNGMMRGEKYDEAQLVRFEVR
jgi:hypothetical protein